MDFALKLPPALNLGVQRDMRVSDMWLSHLYSRYKENESKVLLGLAALAI